MPCQALWERLSDGELRAYWMLLGDEISIGIEGEIDEQALEEKRGLFEKPSPANNVKRLRRYGRASFAGTAAAQQELEGGRQRAAVRLPVGA